MGLYLPPKDEVLAHALGLTELRIGMHSTVEGFEKDRFWVHSYWHATVCPSFDSNFILAGSLIENVPKLDAAEWLAHDSTRFVEEWKRGALFRGIALIHRGQATSAIMERDPVSEAINLAQYGRPTGSMMCDGISYHFRFQTTEVSGQIHISNPVAPSLVALERSLYEHVKTLVECPGGEPFRPVLGLFSAYIQRSNDRQE